jgi:hypothetical protein
MRISEASLTGTDDSLSIHAERILLLIRSGEEGKSTQHQIQISGPWDPLFVCMKIEMLSKMRLILHHQ